MKKILVLISVAALGLAAWVVFVVWAEKPISEVGEGQIAAPDGQRQTTPVVPGGGETRVTLDNGIAVAVPDGLVAEETALNVHHRTPATMPDNSAGFAPIAAVDVELGELDQLSAPVRIEFPLPAELASAGALEDSLACRYYVPELADWGRVPCAFDAERKVAIVTTDHLSTFGFFKIVSGYAFTKFEHNDCKFRAILDQDIPDWSGRLDAVQAALGKACDTYAKLGFTMPDYRVDVVLLNDPAGQDSKYSPEYLYGFIQLPVRPLKVQSLAQLKHDAAHELFHAVQNSELHVARMEYRHWFLEATAEYAAGYLVYPGSGATSLLENDWPYLTLWAPEDSHAYGSAHFINHLLTRSGKNLMELWKAVVREGPQLKGFEIASHAGTRVQSTQGKRESLELIGRILVAEPLDAFLTRHTPASGFGNSLIDHRRDYIAAALASGKIAARSQLDPGVAARLTTIIDEHQLVHQFYPYDSHLAMGTRVEAVSVPGDYAAAVWRIDASGTFSQQARELLLDYPKEIPEGVELSLYAFKEGERADKVAPLALVTHDRPAQPVLLPAGHDLFVIAVNSLPAPVKLPFAVTSLRPDASRRFDVAGTDAAIELPAWMNPEAGDGDALWQARAGDTTSFESVRVFKREAGELAELRAWFEKSAATRFAGFTASAASQDLTVADVPAITREYTGKLEWKLPAKTRLYHEERVRRIKPEETVTIPVRITALFINKGDEALVLEAVSTPADAPWVQPTLRSLQAGVVEGGLVLADNFNSGALDSNWYEQITATGRGGGFKPGPGSRVAMESGFVHIEQAHTDAGGGIITKPFPVFPGNELVIRSRHRIHRLVPDSEGLTPHTLATFGIANEEKTGVLAGVWYAHHDAYHGFFVHGHFAGPSLAPIWDAWFTQELRWNPATGKTTISINGSPPIEAMRGKATGSVRVVAHSYGWWSGHSHDLDDLEIRWVIAPK